MKHAHIIIDLSYGDCGKGTLTDYLTRRHDAHTVIRFNGGPQAAHNVETPDGRHHTFSQFGAGSFVPGVRTLLSRFMLIEPYAMLNEAAHLASVGVTSIMRRLVIDRRCLVITPFQQAANRLREIARGASAHGTCGVGVGETMADSLEHPDMMIRGGDLADAPTLRRKFALIRSHKLAQLKDILIDHPAARTILEPTWIDTAIETYAAVASQAKLVDQNGVDAILNQDGATVFEGAQGVLLDEWFGFHPHTTWSTTTFDNAMTLLDESGYTGERTRLGVLRSYFTRHGAGPFVSEDASLRPFVPEMHNDDGGWQGSFRVGQFDTVAARYALAVAGGVDGLAITHMDRFAALPKRVCTAYEANGETNGVVPHFCPTREDGFAGLLNQGRTARAERNGVRPHLNPVADAIADLGVHRPPNLDYQESLTNLLKCCRPLFSDVPADPRSFVEWLAAALNAPIAFTAAGPTARDWSLCRSHMDIPVAADHIQPRLALLAG